MDLLPHAPVSSGHPENRKDAFPSPPSQSSAPASSHASAVTVDVDDIDDIAEKEKVHHDAEEGNKLFFHLRKAKANANPAEIESKSKPNHRAFPEALLQQV